MKKIICYSYASLVLLTMVNLAYGGNLNIPNTFVSNITAMASDVNANFNAVEVEVDDNAADIATLQSLITTLQSKVAALELKLAAVTDDGTNLLVFSNEGIDLYWVSKYNLETGEKSDELVIEERLISIDYLDEETLVSYGGFDDLMKFWKFGSEIPFRILPGAWWYDEDDIIFSPDLTVMGTLQEGNNLFFWDVNTGDFLGKKYIGYEIKAITFSPDGRLLVITDSNGLIHLWGVKSELE